MKLVQEYEGIHLVCFGCGMYKHKKETCPHGIKDATAAPEQPEGDSSSETSTRKA